MSSKKIDEMNDVELKEYIEKAQNEVANHKKEIKENLNIIFNNPFGILFSILLIYIVSELIRFGLR